MSILFPIKKDLGLQLGISPFQILSENNKSPYLILSKGFAYEAAKLKHFVNIIFELYVQTLFLIEKLYVKINKLNYLRFNDYLASKVRVSYRTKSMLIFQYLICVFVRIANEYSLDLIKNFPDVNINMNRVFVFLSFKSSLDTFQIDKIKRLVCEKKIFVVHPIHSRYKISQIRNDINVLFYFRFFNFFNAFLNNIKRRDGFQ